jgi:hypothetical protein
MMAEYITKDKFIHFLFKEIAYFEETQTDIEIPISATLQSVVNEVKKFTSEDVQPVKHGYWKYETDYCIVCSECGNLSEINCITGDFMESPYCNGCGAKMDGEDNG